VAREWNSHIEWTGHSLLAASAGVSQGSIESVRTCQAPQGLTDEEAVIARYVYEVLRNKQVSDATFTAAHRMLGDRGVVDLTLTISYYTALAVAQTALELEMEPGRVSTL